MGHLRPPAPPVSSLGWSLAGAFALALSLPPLGFYALAWVGLVPLLSRWTLREPSWAYARELYAVLLATSCCVGFWVLFNPDPGSAALGGATLFLVPLPLTAAFLLAGFVRQRHGLAAGLVALTLYVIAAEFLLLQTSITIPWLLLGHTQVEALEFIQTADLGGVSLLSLWVLVLNMAAFHMLPHPAKPGGKGGERSGERGMSAAVFAALVALPVVYGAVRTAQSDVPAGYARIGVVQPGLPPRSWAALSPDDRVDHLVRASDAFLERWNGDQPVADSTAPPDGYGLLLWPQSSLPQARSAREERALFGKLERWASRRHVSLLAGAQLPATPGAEEHHESPGDGELANAAVLVRPGQPSTAYRQMRKIPFADAAGQTSDHRVILDAEGADIGATVGFESVFGDHMRRFAQDGADLIVVLSRNDLWGQSSGLYQHLMFTRLRAIESRRAVVLSTVSGVSAMIQPSGAVNEMAGWMESEVSSVDVPLYRGETFYARHGDWLGRWALVLALAFSVGIVVVGRYFPDALPRPVPAPPSPLRPAIAR